MNRVQVTKADYLVATWPVTDANDAKEPWFKVYVKDGDRMMIRGYVGQKLGKVFFGTNGERYMLSATGASAETVLHDVDFKQLESLSVARYDVQVTFPVPDPDLVIIHTKPGKKYKSTLVTNLNEPGATLYVGSPSSRARLRLYNKTAESGLTAVDGTNLLRIELQLRDEFADAAMTYRRLGQIDKFFLVYVKRMTDAYITSMVEHLFNNPSDLSKVPLEPEGDLVARRMAWLNGSVRPAIVKLALIDKQSVLDFLDALIYDVSNVSTESSGDNRS